MNCTVKVKQYNDTDFISDRFETIIRFENGCTLHGNRSTICVFAPGSKMIFEGSMRLYSTWPRAIQAALEYKDDTAVVKPLPEVAGRWFGITIDGDKQAIIAVRSREAADALIKSDYPDAIVATVDPFDGIPVP